MTRSNRGIDWPIIFIILIIMAFGVMNIYSVDPEYGFKQVVRIALGFGIVIVAMIITSFSKNFFDIYSPIFYIFGIIALIGVLIFGVEINGAKAWYRFGGLTIQPVEIMKIATALMIANILNNPQNDLSQPKVVIQCLMLIAIPAVLIILQPDAGSLFVFGAFFLAMYREGLHPGFLLIPVLFGVVFLVSLVVDSTVFLLLLGIFVWLIFTIISIIYGRRLLNIQGIYLLTGGFLGLTFYFIINLLFIRFFAFENDISSIINFRKEILMSICFTVMAILSLIAALNNYISNRNYNRTVNTFSSSKVANFSQVLTGTVIVLLLMGVVFFISSQAQNILDKLPTHQRERIMVLFEGESKYRDTSGYNLLYSKTAIGSGELWGAGWNKGTVTDGRFVPEQWTDYIFCTVGEEWGFVGSSILVLLYALLIGRIYYLSERQKTTFDRFFGYSIGSIFLLHFFVNIGMVMGLFPTVGIPLPFLSYGGSSLWGFTLMIFIFLKLNYEGKQQFL